MTDKAQENLQIVNFRLTPAEIARLDRLASRFGITRSQYLRNIVMIDIEETETFEKFGIVRAAITVRDIAEWMAQKSRQITEPSSSLTEKKV
ncbi:MAG: hypothetical protein A2005_12510 [Desulfuromonadales bacterium GWC2_61_20]|nr:MAG: hypothetical protein A2005_12510 [Desulfuromonadales bacterium GWC2_61_20]